MKPKNKLQKFLIAIIVTTLVSALGLGFVKKTKFYESSDRNFFNFVSMVRYGIVDYPLQTLTKVFDDTATMWDVRYENDALRRQLEAVNLWKSQINELEEEVNDLKELNNLNDVYSDYSLIHAQVQARSLEEWDQVITIDVGSTSGVEVDDGVISTKGLIGRVIEVQKDTSLVSLLSANNEYSQVATKIRVDKKSSVPGILSDYNIDDDLFSIKLLDSKTTITEGMEVVTSGQGGVFPSGLYMGNVESIKKVADSVGVIVYLESDVNFQNLKYISVVKK